MSVRIGVIAAQFNAEITEGLLAGARARLAEAGLGHDDIALVRVPGAFEIPVTAMRMAETGAFDALVCLGCLIKGETMHFEYIAEATAHGIMEVSIATGVPIAFGVLTTVTEEQAAERSRAGTGNKGREAAAAALEMASLFSRMPSSDARHPE